MARFLVIRLSSMGDIVLTSPVVRCLKKQVDGAEVHFLVKEAYAPILEYNPYIDRVISYDKEDHALVDRLRDVGYDAVIDLQHSLRSASIRRQLGRPSHVFRKLNVRKWLLVNFKIDMMPQDHVVDRYMETVRGLGVINDGRGLDFFLPPEPVLPFTLPEAFIAIAIGGRHHTKMIPGEKMVQVIENLQLPVVLLGGAEDRDRAERIINHPGRQKDPGRAVVNACGSLSIHQSAFVIKNAAAVITGDTGMMHVAAAFRKKIVSVWGSTVPAFGMAPYFGDDAVAGIRMEVQGLRCRPCSKLGFDECPHGHFRCMERHDAVAIAAAANSL